MIQQNKVRISVLLLLTYFACVPSIRSYADEPAKPVRNAGHIKADLEAIDKEEATVYNEDEPDQSKVADINKRREALQNEEKSIQAKAVAAATGNENPDPDATNAIQALSKGLKTEGDEFEAVATEALGTISEAVGKNLLNKDNKTFEMLGLNEKQISVMKAAIISKHGTPTQLAEILKSAKPDSKEYKFAAKGIADKYDAAKQIKGNILPRSPLEIPGKSMEESKLLALQANEQMQIIKNNSKNPEVQDEAAKKLGQIMATASTKDTAHSITLKERLTKAEFSGEFAKMLGMTITAADGKEKPTPTLSEEPRAKPALSAKYNEGFNSIQRAPNPPPPPPPPVQTPASQTAQAMFPITKEQVEKAKHSNPSRYQTDTQYAQAIKPGGEVYRQVFSLKEGQSSKLESMTGMRTTVGDKQFAYARTDRNTDGSVSHIYRNEDGSLYIWNNKRGGFGSVIATTERGQASSHAVGEGNLADFLITQNSNSAIPKWNYNTGFQNNVTIPLTQNTQYRAPQARARLMRFRR